MDNLGIILVILVAMGFNYTNGFHDAANAIATSVSTRALTPRVALVMAAIINLLGSFLGAKVAKTVGSGIIELPDGKSSLVVVFAALIGAIVWNLLTWYFGLPSSSSHAADRRPGRRGAGRRRTPCCGAASSTRCSSRWSSRRWSASGSATS